jgi:hypothetical protein
MLKNNMNMQNTKKFIFNISLSVLNHLGRNLYRNFITVLGEAISNSWDADANNVWIYINKKSGELTIKDDGLGMSEDDFRNKFLKVGYSKRGVNSSHTKSPNGRPYIGRKGIGKLALLSCAKKISVISKLKNSKYVGGTINNASLDKAISEDSSNYDLEGVDFTKFTPYTKGHKHGTIVHFKDVNDGIKNTVGYLSKLLALYFRFSLIDKSFSIFLNDKEITENNLISLAEKTQLLWNINTLDDPYITQELTKLKRSNLLIISKVNVKGFIASVEKPRYLKISDTEEKTGIDLFVNGRLRERNILKHMPNYSTRHVASYLYGQIHFDELDQGGDDSFTTSREGIKDGDPEYEKLLKVLREKTLEEISDEWDKWRLEINEEGDDENPRKTPKERKANSLYNLASKDYKDNTNKKIKKWVKDLQPDAEFNIPAYVDCFLSENLVRKYIKEKQIPPIKPAQDEIDTWKPREEARKAEANISFDIREHNDDLSYLGMDMLAKTVDGSSNQSNTASLVRDAIQFKPMRNAVGHTGLLTKNAKQRLQLVYENIKGRLGKLLSD